MIKCIISDLGGVVVNYDESMYCNYISKKFNLDYNDVLKLFLEVNSKMEVDEAKASDLYDMLYDKFGIPKDGNEWESFFEDTATLNDGLLSLYDKLRKDYSLALLSNLTIPRYLEVKKLFFSRFHFEKMYFSCYLKMKKPNKDIYEYVLNDLGFDPNEVLFIDNMKVNVDGAKELGMNGIVFKDNDQLLKDLEKLGIKH